MQSASKGTVMYTAALPVSYSSSHVPFAMVRRNRSELGMPGIFSHLIHCSVTLGHPEIFLGYQSWKPIRTFPDLYKQS